MGAVALDQGVGVVPRAGVASLRLRSVSAERTMMGGRVAIHLRAAPVSVALVNPAERVLDRLASWASRLTRFEPGSELTRLNAATSGSVQVGPTMAAVLDWAREAEGRTSGLVDVAMLDARLAAEAGVTSNPPPAPARRWSVRRLPRGAIVERPPGLRFDLDGIAKGWLADRALALAPGRSAMVDADGDIAARVAPGDSWAIGIADPTDPDDLLAVVRLTAKGSPLLAGLATSGTSVHRWERPTGSAHHLIDPATWRSATTDVVQATVLASSARLAECIAKAAVISGAAHAFEVADRPSVFGVLVLTEGGELLASDGMLPWLA